MSWSNTVSSFAADNWPIFANPVDISKYHYELTLMFPLQRQLYLDPFPPLALPNLNSTMDHLTSYTSSHGAHLFSSHPQYSIREERTGSPTFIKYLWLHARLYDPEGAAIHYPIHVSRCCLRSSSRTLDHPRCVDNGAQSLLFSLPAYNLSVYAWHWTLPANAQDSINDVRGTHFHYRTFNG